MRKTVLIILSIIAISFISVKGYKNYKLNKIKEFCSVKLKKYQKESSTLCVSDAMNSIINNVFKCMKDENSKEFLLLKKKCDNDLKEVSWMQSKAVVSKIKTLKNCTNSIEDYVNNYKVKQDCDVMVRAAPIAISLCGKFDIHLDKNKEKFKKCMEENENDTSKKYYKNNPTKSVFYIDYNKKK